MAQRTVTTVLLARQLLTPLQRIDDAALLIDDGTISAVGSRDAVSVPDNARVIDFGDAVLAPGLIDIHIHGGAGRDVMEGSGEGLAAIEADDGAPRRNELLPDDGHGADGSNAEGAGTFG